MSSKLGREIITNHTLNTTMGYGYYIRRERLKHRYIRFSNNSEIRPRAR